LDGDSSPIKLRCTELLWEGNALVVYSLGMTRIVPRLESTLR
jgi:hypothetical protein